MLLVVRLMEKLPQTLMQIGWMEDNFRNLTAKVWANVDNPIKRYDGNLLISVMSQQQQSIGTVHTFFFFWYKISRFMKMHLPSCFILRYVRAEMNVHAFMNEMDQKDYWYSRKFENCENLCTKSIRVVLLWNHIFWPSSIYTTLHNHFS